MKIGVIASAAMIALGALSVLVMVANANDHEKEDQMLQLRSSKEIYNEKKMYSEAIDCYKSMIRLDENNYDLIIEYRDYCSEHDFDANKADACIMAMNLKPDDYDSAKIYLNYLVESEAKMSAVYSFVKGRIQVLDGEDKQYFSDYYDSIKGLFTEYRDRYSYIGQWHNDYILLNQGGSLSLISGKEIYAAGKNLDNVNVFLDSEGVTAAGGNIENAMSYSPGEGLIAGIDEEQPVYMTLSGARKIVPFDYQKTELINYTYLGPFGKGIANFSDNGSWGYINKNADVLSEGLEYASALSNGVGAVKKEGKYAFLKYTSEGFTMLTDYIYDDVLFDESGYAFSYGYTYVKENGSGWRLAKLSLNEANTVVEGIRVFDEREYEDVRLFGIYGAVKKDGKWGFIDSENQWLIEPAYKDAKSFACGLAPVVVDSLWGYIDTAGKMIIEPQFMEANEFNQNGIAAVNNLEQWRFIQLTEYTY